jgi:REP element-mobilizing transposase RayT
MILGHHVVFSTYGFWLPNDPRGSGSAYVGSLRIYPYGNATKTDSPRSVAAKPHDRVERMSAKDALKYPPVRFDSRQIAIVAAAFDEYRQRSGLIVWACAIMPDHVHLVLKKSSARVEQIVNLLKGAATKRLMSEHIHPLAGYADEGRRCPSPWGKGCWKKFLNTSDDVLRAIRYVQANPLKDGRPRQNWKFVTPFDARRPQGGG